MTTNITEPEVVDKPAKPDVPDQSKQPETSGKAKPVDAGGKDKPAEGDDKPSFKKAGKIVLYAFIAAAALLLVKYLFFTPPEVVVAQVSQRDYTGEVQGTGTINVDVLAAVGAKIPGRIERMLVN